jgi:hypothetical protein
MWMSLETPQAAMQAALIDIAVLKTALCLEIAGTRAALKLGQYMYRNTVPTMATV